MSEKEEIHIKPIHVVLIEPNIVSRRLDPKESQPFSLSRDQINDQPVLKWINEAVNHLNRVKTTYVGGYHIEKIIESYADLDYIFQKDRNNTGELTSLLYFQDVNCDILVIRADLLLLPEGINALLDYDKIQFGTVKTINNEELVVAAYFPNLFLSTIFDEAKLLASKNKHSGLRDLYERLDSNLADRVTIDGKAAVINDKEAVAKTIFKGKVQTLDTIATISEKANVLPRIYFSVEEWKSNSELLLKNIQKEFGAELIIVRSNSSTEDSLYNSCAGMFETIQNINAGNKDKVSCAVNQVINSYSKGKRNISKNDLVLIQPQIQNLVSSGVLLTFDNNNGAPYFIVNTDEDSGRSDVVTAGDKGKLRTFFVLPDYETSHLPKTIQKVVSVGNEIKQLTHIDALDIEFGITKNNVFHLFQARPLLSKTHLQISFEDFYNVIDESVKFTSSVLSEKSNVIGQSSILGVMPDWNPAEMIGDAPKPLALSLYQSLIGDNSWSEARSIIGYKDVFPNPLIYSIAGKPYVDVRCSLNSFLPNDLKNDIAKKYIDGAINTLIDNPELHDKIEFEVALSCVTPDWEYKEDLLDKFGLSRKEKNDFKLSLQKLTNSILNSEGMSCESLLEKMDLMSKRRDKYITNESKSVSNIANKIRLLFEDCREYGIVPFAILARYAFISMSLLKGLKQIGVLSEKEYESVINSIPTVASKYSSDIDSYKAGDITIDQILHEYGHLRPNSYDITSTNYASNPSKYFTQAGKNQSIHANFDIYKVLDQKKTQIENSFKEVGIEISFDKFIEFIRLSIAGREKAKFEFMKNLNLILEGISEIGALLGFTREQLAYLPITEFTRMATDSFTSTQTGYLRRTIQYKEKQWFITRAIRLPDLISDPTQITGFELANEKPNFITRDDVTASVVWLDDVKDNIDLSGKIVAIISADPGYDWIFGYNLKGLITKYGGAGSHMSIRAAEFGLPAAIGCGELLFESLQHASIIQIDCLNEKVRRMG
jgi:glutamine kinase